MYTNSSQYAKLYLSREGFGRRRLLAFHSASVEVSEMPEPLSIDDFIRRQFALGIRLADIRMYGV